MQYDNPNTYDSNTYDDIIQVKPPTQWIPPLGIGQVQVQSGLFLQDNLGNLMQDNLGNILVPTAFYITGRQTSWTQSTKNTTSWTRGYLLNQTGLVLQDNLGNTIVDNLGDTLIPNPYYVTNKPVTEWIPAHNA